MVPFTAGLKRESMASRTKPQIYTAGSAVGDHDVARPGVAYCM